MGLRTFKTTTNNSSIDDATFDVVADTMTDTMNDVICSQRTLPMKLSFKTLL